MTSLGCTLTVIQDAVKMIENTTGVKLDVERSILMIKKVMDSLGTGKNEGVFQLESAGFKTFMEGIASDYPGGCHSRNLPVSSRSYGFYPEIFSGKKSPGCGNLCLSPAGADLKADLRLYRLSGAGHADRS